MAMAQEVMRAPGPRVISGEPDLQRSSCEIKTSTRGTDLTVKCYAGSPVRDAVDEALAEYQRAYVLMESWLMGHRAGSA